jgi:signal peptide peptidase SppA
MRYPLIIKELTGQLWAIMPGEHERLTTILNRHITGESNDDGLDLARQIRETRAANLDVARAQSSPKIALIALHGTIVRRGGMAEASGYTTPYSFASAVRAAADDPEISEIILDVDSPGGVVAGTDVAAEAVAYARTKKRVTASASGLLASAAYWIASQAHEITVTPATIAGSIGVIAAHVDVREQDATCGVKVTYVRSAPKKALGQAEEEFSDEVRTNWQDELDAIHTVFVQAVADGRGVSLEEAQGWADGDTHVGEAAVKLGLADRVASLDAVITEARARLEKSGANRSRAHAGKGTSMKLTLKHPRTAASLEIDTEASDAEAQIQTQVANAWADGEKSGMNAAQQSYADHLGLEPSAMTREGLQALSREAEAGRTYRANLEDRLTKSAVRAKGQDAGAALSERLLKAFKTLPVEDLEAQVTELEAEAEAIIPNARLSQDAAPPSTRAPQPADIDY